MYQFAFRNLWVKKSRTLLALVGLVIAIVGIVTLVSISAGIRYEVTSVFSKMEGVSVMQKGSFAPPQSHVPLSYLDKLSSIQGVNVAIPIVTGIASDFEGKSSSAASIMGGMIEIMGIDPELALKTPKGSLYNPDIVLGRAIKTADRNGVMIGKAISTEYKKTVGDKVKFNGREFRIVGIFDTGSDMTNNLVVMPLSIAQNLTSRTSDDVGMIYLSLNNPKDAEAVATRVNFKYNNTANDPITATTGTSFADSISGLLGSLDMFFYGVSSIALVVGVIGILNTMLMSVKERTREFGILKAVGWTRNDIIKLVFFESFFLGIVGGAVGLILSVIFVTIASPLVGITMVITVDMAIYAFAVALFSGIGGGLYPAWQAAVLDPVEAIRYE